MGFFHLSVYSVTGIQGVNALVIGDLAQISFNE
jgi:hypothetical protein